MTGIPPRVHEGETLRLTIEKLVHGGYGLSHYGRQVCFIKNAIPDEVVDVVIEKVKTHYLQGVAEKIVTVSPYRIAPQCPIFSHCGGCQWQHMTYEHQLFWKFRIVKEAIERIGGTRGIDFSLPIASTSPLHYRYRSTLHISGKEIGYFKEKSHEIVPVRNCLVIASPLNEVLRICRSKLREGSYFFSSHRGRLHLLFLKRTGDVLAIAESIGKDRQKYIFKKDEERMFVMTKDEAIDDIDGLLFKRTPENFYQINYEQNRMLIRFVMECICPEPGDEILELYCGSGNFSLFLAKSGAYVTGIEINESAVREARENCKINGINTCKFLKEDVNNLTPSIFKKTYKAILLNPPRSGCTKNVINGIISGCSKNVVYVSCNPSTLARDIRLLVDNGYYIEKIQPFDLFPQTWHIETVVVMRKKAKLQ